MNLLLAGVFDSFARVSARLFNIEFRQPSFRKLAFLKAIQTSTADRFAKLVAEPNFRALIDTVHLLRNSIHEQSWKHLTSRVQDQPESVLIDVSHDDAHLADQLRGLMRNAEWSIVFFGKFGIEPYGWSLKTTSEAIGWLNRMALAVMADLRIPESEGPKLGGLLGSETDEREMVARLDLLG